jgi:hypothetical protein
VLEYILLHYLINREKHNRDAGHMVAQLIEALHHEPEGHGFDSDVIRIFL